MVSTEKMKCNCCLKYFTKNTLNKYKGKCGRCINLTNSLNPSMSGKVIITKTQKRIIWKAYAKQIQENFGLCTLCNISEININTMVIGYNIDTSLGGTLNIKNSMPICGGCKYEQKGLTFREFRAMKRTLVPNKCYRCCKFYTSGDINNYNYSCCNIKCCIECVNNTQYFDGFSILYCPKCQKQTSISKALIYYLFFF
jgi:hypothetical protein